MKNQSIIWSCICITLFFLSVPLTTVARDVTVAPSIDIKCEYDDNVTFTRTNEEDDFLTRINPALTLNYATELLKLQSGIDIDFLRYADETDLNTEHQRYNLNGSYQLRERYTISGNSSYVKDTLLETYLEQTGIVDEPPIERDDREYYNAGMGLSYQVSEQSSMTINYNHAETDYEWEEHEDSDSDSITFSFNHHFNNQLDVFTVQPYYVRQDSEITKLNNYGLSLGLLHPFSETLSLSAFMGARYTRIDYTIEPRFEGFFWGVPIYHAYNPDTGTWELSTEPTEVHEKDDKWGAVADINLEKSGETLSAAIGYSRDIDFSSYGELIERDRIHCSANRKLTKRLNVSFSGTLHFTKSEGDYGDRDSRHFALRPSLRYRITENHSLSLNYSYSNYYDKNRADNRDKDRNRIWIGLHFKFPRKW